MTGRDEYPNCKMDECLESLGEVCIFLTLDADLRIYKSKSGNGTRTKSTFPMHHEQCRFLRMTFGLKSAKDVFPRAVDLILLTVKCQFALAYLEDVFMLSKPVEGYLDRLRTVLGLQPRVSMSLKLQKFFFFEDSIAYLGHAI